MSKKLTAVSLFTGAGGMDVGFESAGVQVLIANELMKEASETYKENHPNTKIINADINTVIDSFSEYNGADLVFGGPPCQGFSVAGKMNPNDQRSKLIFSYLNVVEKVRPKLFVMENVTHIFLVEYKNAMISGASIHSGRFRSCTITKSRASFCFSRETGTEAGFPSPHTGYWRKLPPMYAVQCPRYLPNCRSTSLYISLVYE